MSNFDAVMPPDGSGSEYIERLKAAIAGRYSMTRTEYLDEIQRITLETPTLTATVDGFRAQRSGQSLADELRHHKWNEYAGPGQFTEDGRKVTRPWRTGKQPGLSTRGWCEMRDADDQAARPERE